MEPEPKLPSWLTKNLWAIVAMVLAAFQGYNVGTNAMAKVTDDVAGMKAGAVNRRPFLQCLDRRIYHIENKIPGPAPCAVDFPE